MNHKHMCPKHGLEYCSNENKDENKKDLEIHFCMNYVDIFRDGWKE